MNIQNRDRFLDNIAKNLGRPRQTDKVERPNWTVQPQWEILKNDTQDELIHVLKKQCEAIHTEFRKTTMEKLPNVIQEIIELYEGESIVVAEDERNKIYGLTELFCHLQQNGKDVHVWDSHKGKENRNIAERADIGITFSDMTLAESGTVTLLNDKNNARSISLLPRTYIAIIPKNTLVPRLSQAAKWLHENEKLGKKVPSCISFISGPSNSADIEMNLIVGVHGPVKTAYIVVE